MFNPISNKVHNLWEQWNIRGLILFSLFLQIFLTTCSPQRKRVSKGLLQYSIWVAYLIADWVANFCVGHIASSQVSDNKSSISTHSHLLAFWAPFLLVHLGGPDTITAFSLEDNQLWRRHMLGFIIQFTTCAYVFLLTVPGNSLWIPTVLVFVAGMIKYGERIYSLHRASNNDQPTPSHVRIFPTDPHLRDHLGEIEFILNYTYEAFFTKFPLLNAKIAGCILRFVAISCVLTAFGLFFNEDKHRQGFNHFDVKVTYTLLFGAIALDTIALLMLPFSTFFPTRIPGRYLDYLKRPQWSGCKKKPFTKFKELSTWLPLRRWNGSIPGFNMISYCHSMMTTTKYYKCIVPSHYRCSAIFTRLHVVKNPFLFELWELICGDHERQELRREGRPCEYFANWWIDLNLKESLISDEHRKTLMNFMVDDKEIGFDYNILVWHIATCLCYAQEKDDQIKERELSKLLSDYMLYLLIVHSNIRSLVRGHEKELGLPTFLERFRATIREIMQFFNNDEDEAKACMNLLASDQSRSPLLDLACMLANELGMIPITSSIKWKIISHVWIEMLSCLAFKCNLSIHVQHLSEGGEFISLVWMSKLAINPGWFILTRY
ncbi:hypothetical protein RIF29_31627 [Crotalaria pallida]|uniref:DUF4220 domain-containing protein n=1 Tax=Crotalaria pallida TaxID=3830 RepID=A0AAN9EJM3_CROPI